MFNLGDRIIVLESNSKTCKRGSVGYVSTTVTVKLSDKVDALLAMAEVFFERYGFELKKRCEKQNVIFILPIAVADQKTKPIDLLIEDLKEDLIAVGYIDTRQIVTVATQYKPIDLLSCDPREFMCWTDAILCDYAFRMFLSSVNTKHKNNISNIDSMKQSLGYMLECCGNKTFRRESFDGWLKNRESMVTTIRTLTCLKNTSDFKEWLGMYGFVEFEFLLKKISSNIYTNAFLRKEYLNDLRDIVRQLKAAQVTLSKRLEKIEN